MTRSLTLVVLLLTATAGAADAQSRPRGEFLRMWDSIASGEPMGSNSGWFGPSQSRYTWDRLKVRDKNKDGRITKDEFGGPADLFSVLDRDGDGAITADDFDWSDSAAYFRQLGTAQQMVRKGDSDGNKKLSKEEWAALFDELAKGKPAIEAEDLRRVLFPPSSGRPPGGAGMPPTEVLLFGLLTGEIGSGAEGPKLNAAAPDFTLKSADGKTTITLSDSKDKKPVALIFGSFT